jgi:hypothetical protein
MVNQLPSFEAKPWTRNKDAFAPTATATASNPTQSLNKEIHTNFRKGMVINL